jgi:hypothetical protein
VVFLGAAFVVALEAYLTFHHYTIVITDDTISGPSASGRKTVSIARERIDKTKTRRTRWLDKIEGRWNVHSVNGDRLILSGMAFDKNQISTILKKIGCEVQD